MKIVNLVYIIPAAIIFNSTGVLAQLPRVKALAGTICIDDGNMVGAKPDGKKYAPLVDSLDKRLKINANDTTCLFYRALFYMSYNDILAAPYQETKGVLENLVVGKNMTEKAIGLRMQNFNLKILRAQIYQNLCYRYTGDESWKYSNAQIESRRKQFNTYKELANKYYDELAVLDKGHAYDYHKLKVTDNYPL